MRLHRIRFSVRRMMIAVALVTIAIWTGSRYSWGWKYYAAGWWDAERELWGGDATIYSMGGLVTGDICNIDQETGLPFHSVSGCVGYDGDMERVQGHNDHMNQYIRWHGLPGNTLKPWMKELFALKAFFGGQSRAQGARRLLAGGPTVASPDRKTSIRPIAGVRDDGSPSRGLQVIITADNAVLGTRYARFGDGDSELVWGPDGSPFAVIRSISESEELYVACDLRTGLCLCTETWNDGKRLPLWPEVHSSVGR
jgi:hypothetical protein